MELNKQQIRNYIEATKHAYTKAEKMEICNAIGFTSMKAKEIQAYLYGLLRQLRNDNPTELDFEDAKDFIRADYMKDVYNKLVPELDEEPIEMVHVLAKYNQHRIEEDDKKYGKSPYGPSNYKKMLYNREKMFARYLNEQSESFASKIALIKKISEKVIENGAEYKKLFTQQYMNYLNRYYMKLYKGNEAEVAKRMEGAEEEATQAFNNHAMVVAERMVRHGADENVEVRHVGSDDMYLEIIFKNANGKIKHGRSIICAEYSALVETHFRFLIS